MKKTKAPKQPLFSANENISPAAQLGDPVAPKWAESGLIGGLVDRPALQGPAENFPDFCLRRAKEDLEALDAKLALLRKHKVASYSEHGISIVFDRSAFVDPTPKREEPKEPRDPHFDGDEPDLEE